ncbi:MAG: zinc ribbon domain-containing protein [Thermodesulfobacteriota bacterium]
MPLYEYQCQECGQTTEILITAGDDTKPRCGQCGSGQLKKLLSAPSSMSGVARDKLPGQSDTGCCGMSSGHSSCAGPGSCCGRAK